MTDREVSRRNFLSGSATGAAVALLDPGLAAARSVAVKRSDLPDLTIKEVKVYWGCWRMRTGWRLRHTIGVMSLI